MGGGTGDHHRHHGYHLFSGSDLHQRADHHLLHRHHSVNPLGVFQRQDGYQLAIRERGSPSVKLAFFMGGRSIWLAAGPMWTLGILSTPWRL